LCEAALLDCSFLFRTAERETEPKRKAAGCIPEAKKWQKIPKTGKRASLGRARFFTEFFTIFLHASETRPELNPVV
jgi:hypothetical protein